MIKSLMKNLRRNEDGAIVIETAFVVPVLLLMSLGAIDYGTTLARQIELQNAMAEASQIALAAAPTDAAARQAVKEVLQTSTGLTTDDISIVETYRCGTSEDYVADSDECGDDPYARFIRIEVIENYKPVWTVISGAQPLRFHFVRMVQVG